MSSALNTDAYWDALIRRDARFDGRFFAGVKTTGIYCRPICPARKPHRRNVVFFVCAAAAEESGFRPCRRCRPETAPHTAAWIGTSATVSRALRLIDQGALDGNRSVDELAERLGMGSRQLRRLFQQHLAASPVSLAQTRRAHFARAVLEQTTLGLDEIAVASGFGSVRRFRDVMQQTFGHPPSKLRGTKSQSADLRLRLPFRPPLDFEHLLSFLDARAIPDIEEVSGPVYRRLVMIGEHRGQLEVRRLDETHLELKAELTLTPVLIDVTRRIRQVFDLDADSAVIDEALGRHPALRASIKKYPGLRVPGAFDGFETTVRAIVGQQVSVKAANTLMGRLISSHGPLTPGKLEMADIGSIGMPRSRVDTLQRAARTFTADTPELDQLAALKGIGPWTRDYLGMRVYRDPDAFPAGDLVLRRAAGKNEPLSTSALEKLARPWRPWRAYAAMHLWRMKS